MVAAAATMPGPAEAQYNRFGEKSPVVHNLFGEVGIFDMPSAHMAPDGELAFVVGDLGLTQRYSFTFQHSDWFEGSFRYSRVAGLFIKETNFHDRSASVKIRLQKETDEWPDISIGIRDFMGTGVYSGEYAVASKHFGPFDITLGLGTGQFADRDFAPNPLGFFMSRFKTRGVNDFGDGGVPGYRTFFRGRLGLFGGFVYETPIKGLSFLAEYSSMKDQSAAEGYTQAGTIAMRSPVNFGLSYRPVNFFAITGGWMYGSTYGISLTVNGNANSSYPNAMRVGPKVPPPALRQDSQQQSALNAMGQNTRGTLATKAGAPWVKLPTPAERTKQDLLQAFMSEGRGVRGVEVHGKSAVIDARLANDGRAQCSRYAKIASAVGAELTNIAINDLEDPKGTVTFCPIASNGNANVAMRGESLFTTGETDALRSRIAKGLEAQAIQLDAMFASQSEIWVYTENYKYYNETEAVGRAIRVLMAEAPPSVEVFHIIITVVGVPHRQITVTRSAMERTLLSYGNASGMGNALSIEPAPPLSSAAYSQIADRYPAFFWSLDPKITQHLFDPDRPMQIMFYADATALLQIAPGLMIAAEGTSELWSNYTFDRAPGSNLPHVRTDLLQYIKRGKNGIESLQLIYTGRLAPEIYGEFKAGIFEQMYTGVGAQMLWRPDHSRFSLGMDIYQVWKRDFNRLFGVQEYDIATGHVSVYYESPWQGLNLAVHAGRYLAGDWGATFQISRRFSSGIEIGAWATFTDVPFDKFGEGSFDKGIIVHIPFQWGLPIWSRSSYDLRLPSLTRDGGQRLMNDDSLYGETLSTSYGEITRHIDDVVQP